MKDLIVKDRQFYRNVLMVATPIILQSMITVGVNIMDTIMLGSLGEMQISASSLANSFIEIFQTFHMGIGGGAGVMISQYWGMQDRPSIKKVVSIMFRISLASAILFTLAAAFLPSAIMSVYTGDAAVIEYGKQYLLWSLPGFLLQGVTLIMTLSLRSMRKVKVPFIASCVSFFVNIFFNWMFIFGHLGAPRMEIAGAALGTILARFAECTVIAVYYFRLEKDIAIRPKDLLISPEGEWKTFFKYGIAVIASDLFLVAGNNMLAIIMGHIGTAFVAANSIVIPVMRLCNVFNIGLNHSSAAFTGNIIGEKGIEEGKKAGTTFVLLSILVGIFAAFVLILICPLVVNMYNITDETKDIARQLMYGLSLSMPFFTSQAVLTKGVLRAGGDTTFVLVVESVFVWFISIPLGALCGLRWGLSPFVVYMALRADYILKSIACIGRLKTGKWIRRIR